MVSDDEIKEILSECKTIAVVGCSNNSGKAAHEIPRKMQSYGYKIIPVNPNADEILGEQSRFRLEDIKEPIDIVNIFRPSEETPAIVRSVLRLNSKPKIVWMQIGISNEDAKELAEKNGIKVVMNKCIMVEYNRLMI